MRITMTNEEMFECIETMEELKETGKLGYAIAKNTRRFKEAVTEYLELRKKVFREYGVVDERRGTTEVPIGLFREKTEEIAKIEEEVEIFQVDEETFVSGNLTSPQMEKLMWMVKANGKSGNAL